MYESCFWEDSLGQFLDVDPETEEPKCYDLMQRLVKNLFLLFSCNQKMMNFHYFEAE